MIIHIFASDANGIIGINNTLPWHYPLDLQYFKNNTVNQTIIMGYNTFLSLGYKPLPNRKNIVITNKPTESEYKNLLFLTLEEVFLEVKKTDLVYVIGGAKTLLLFPEPDSVLHTVVPEVQNILETDLVSKIDLSYLEKYKILSSFKMSELTFNTYIKL